LAHLPPEMADLGELAKEWAALPEVVKAGIVAIVRAASDASPTPRPKA